MPVTYTFGREPADRGPRDRSKRMAGRRHLDPESLSDQLVRNERCNVRFIFDDHNYLHDSAHAHHLRVGANAD